MNKRFQVLDAFRGLAALCVVVFHMHIVSSITELDFFRGSAVFVQFFFVLSGFVLAHGYGTRENLVFVSFVKARFFRLYPLHLFMFLVFLFLETGKLLAFNYGGFIFNNVPFTNGTDFSEILPNLLLIHAWTPAWNHLSFNYLSWSVSIEFYLYLLLFLSIVTLNKLKGLVWALISLATLCLLVVGSELLVRPVLNGLSCFFGGATMYLLYQKISHIQINKLLGSLVELVIIACIILLVQTGFKYHNAVTAILFFCTILVFSFESGAVSSLLKLKPFQTLGKLSYSIYMTHAAILFCVTALLMVLQRVMGVELAPMQNDYRYLTLGNAFINNLLTLAIIALVILISSFTYRYIELKWKRSLASN